MSSAPRRVRATFWLLEAPDNLAAQSRRNPDGTGLGFFDSHHAPHVYKRPIAAYQDENFAHEAREVESTTFVAHVRYASTGAKEPRNTHPFAHDRLLFAHNGVIENLAALDSKLGDYLSMVGGETDSERFFALIVAQMDAHGGDVTTAVASAARWVAANLPLFSLNLVLVGPSELWALRYPDSHALYVLERAAGGHHGDRHLDHGSATGTVRVRSGDLADGPAVVIASERMDEDPGWRLLEPGELLHVDSSLKVHSRAAVTGEPAHRLTLADLHPGAAASQSAR